MHCIYVKSLKVISSCCPSSLNFQTATMALTLDDLWIYRFWHCSDSLLQYFSQLKIASRAHRNQTYLCFSKLYVTNNANLRRLIQRFYSSQGLWRKLVYTYSIFVNLGHSRNPMAHLKSRPTDKHLHSNVFEITYIVHGVIKYIF